MMRAGTKLDMRKNAAVWTSLALLGVLVLCYVAYGLAHPPKARLQRVQAVNTLRSVSITLTNTNAAPNTLPGPGR